MKTNELEKDLIIADWFDNINPSENTKPVYLGSMQAYTEFASMSPDELITEAETDITTGVLSGRRRIKRHLASFRRHLQEKGLASKTIQNHLSAVRSFYTSFEIDLPKLSKTDTAVPLEENMPIPTKSDLQAVLKVCDVMEKALVLVGVSSGLSANEIMRLKVKQFCGGHDKETGITILSLRRQKVKFDFITFLTPEASSAVMDYLAYRNRKAKTSQDNRYNQLEKQKVFSDSNYLFCKQHVSDKFLNTMNDNDRKLTKGIIMRIFESISEKARLNTPYGAWNLIRSHNMRKYFNSVLLNEGCDSYMVNFFMGHKQDATRAAYFRASSEKLKEMYMKYVPYLTIQKALDVSESPEYQKIKNENQILVAETVKHVVERSELRDLRNELELARAETASKTAEIDKMKKELREEMRQEVKAGIQDSQTKYTELQEVLQEILGGRKERMEKRKQEYKAAKQNTQN